MMFTRPKSAYILILTLLVGILFITGCTPAATTVLPTNTVQAAAQAAEESTLPSPTTPPTEVPTAEATATEAATAATVATATTVAAATATTEATATATEAANAAAGATATPAPAGQVEQGFSAWCLPLNAAVSNAKDPLNPPANAKKAKVTNNTLEVSGLPSNGCMFLYTFDKAAPGGLKLEVYELKQPKPFFTADLQPASGKEETVWAFVRHTMITAPPKQSLSFSFVVRDSLGQVLGRSQANIHSWVDAATPMPQSNGDCGCAITPPVLPPDE